VDDDTLDGWRHLLQQIPLDERSFNDRYAPLVCDTLVRGLAKWCLEFRSRSMRYQHSHQGLFAFLSLLLITWLGTRESDRRRKASLDGESSRLPYATAVSHDCDRLCRPLLRDPLVREAILLLYGDGGTKHGQEGFDAAALERWNDIEPESLSFHRHGTTSIIVKGRIGVRDTFALKLILFPFLRFPSIARQTREYHARYNPDDLATGYMVDVWASTERWILMDFVDGISLFELLPRRQLVAEKLAHPELSFSQILRARLGRQPTESQRGGAPGAVDPASLSLDELLRLGDAREEPAPGRRHAAGEKISLHWIESLGSALLDALVGVQRYVAVRAGEAAKRKPSREAAEGSLPPGVHGDLTPSNILVTDAPGLTFTLIDFGRNYLYTQAIPGQAYWDASYLAPEIKKEDGPAEKADLYSLGKLLITFGLQGGRPGDIIPDAFYARTPFIARFLEDLVQDDPAQRLTIFADHGGESGRQSSYAALRTFFTEELDAVKAAEKEGLKLGEDSYLAVLLDLLKPMSGAPARQWRLWRKRRNQEHYRRREQGTYTRWLFMWSSVAAIAGTITFAAVVTWFLRDAGWSWGDRAIEAVQKLTGGNPNRFPVIDDLRMPGYHVPDLAANWPARLVGFSYVLIGARYYQSLFASLTPLLGRRRGLSGWRALLAEFFMRAETVTAMVLVLAATLFDARWWPIASAIGQTMSLFCNWAVVSFATKALAEARGHGISTVAQDDHAITGLDSFHEWVPSSLFYAAVVWLIGSLIYIQVLHDIPIYAISVAAVNIFLFYMIKCGIGAPTIRVAIARACLAAERVRVKSLAQTSGGAESQGLRAVTVPPVSASPTPVSRGAS
jgi:serine/threonine protein kinase